MKNFLFLILFSFILPANISGQSYQEMLNHDIEWQLTSCNNGCITDVYFTDGDTLYNGFNYKILNGYHYISKTFWLREHINDQKVFLSFLQNNIRKEVLLYDFNLSKGDSLNISNPISPFPTNPGFYIVDSTSVIQLNDGLYYEHFYLSSLDTSINESPVWIEGIGSLSLINSPGGTPNVNGAGKLSCYFNNGNSVYSQLDSISSCVFTNPSLGQINLNNIQTKEIVRVSNLLGSNTTKRKNEILLYHYDDGTVEKRVIIF